MVIKTKKEAKVTLPLDSIPKTQIKQGTKMRLGMSITTLETNWL
jgi:hypothetical protein